MYSIVNVIVIAKYGQKIKLNSYQKLFVDSIK